MMRDTKKTNTKARAGRKADKKRSPAAKGRANDEIKGIRKVLLVTVFFIIIGVAIAIISFITGKWMA